MGATSRTASTTPPKTFVANAALLGKVYFHRLVIPVSLVISNLIAFGIQFGIFLVVMAVYVAVGRAAPPDRLGVC